MAGVVSADHRVDLKQADGLLLCAAIELRDKDIAVITSAETAQLQKDVQLVRQFTGVYFDISRGVTGYLPSTP